MEKENIEEETEVKEKIPIEIPIAAVAEKKAFDKEAWQPKTLIGRRVKAGEIKSIDEILDKGIKILEPEIVDALVPNLETDFVRIGQSKGKFGGGKRSIWRQTQKKTNEGNKPRFGALVVVGNKDGIIGIGRGKAKETVPAREKAIRQAKLNIIKVKRGCGSWECACDIPHSISFKIESKCGSSKIILIPAPKGANLKIEKECQRLLSLAGIKDIYSKTFGQSRTKINLVSACFDALRKLGSKKLHPNLKRLEILENA